MASTRSKRASGMRGNSRSSASRSSNDNSTSAVVSAIDGSPSARSRRREAGGGWPRPKGGRRSPGASGHVPTQAPGGDATSIDDGLLHRRAEGLPEDDPRLLR